MSGSLALPAPYPGIGPYLPIGVVRVGITVILAGSSLILLPDYLPATLAFCTAMLMVVLRRVQLGWVLMVLLAVTVLAYETHPAIPRVVLAVAAIHATHELGAMLVWLPARGRIQLVVLARVLRRYLLVELPVQAIVVVTCVFAIPTAGAQLASPLFGLAGAIALLVLVVLIVVPRLRNRG
ncbi:MAG TPA: hypothetical protein VGI56_02090 [Galbitalea sp.]|jgi:hypothetical protein